MTLIDDQEEREELDLAAPEIRAAGRWNSAGVPGERSKDFKSALRRLGRMLGPMWVVLAIVAVIAIISAILNVLGPLVLARGTNIIVDGVTTTGSINFVPRSASSFLARSSLSSSTRDLPIGRP